MEDNEDVVKLANKVAEAEEKDVPNLLLHMEGILLKYSADNKTSQRIKKDIWKYDLLSWCSLALKYDFTHISGNYETAARIIALLCQCCVGINIEESQEFSQSTLPDAIQSSLQINWQLQQMYKGNSKFATQTSLELYQHIMESIISLITCHIYLTKNVIASENTLRLLMEESDQKSLFTCSAIRLVLRCLQANKFTISQTKRNTVYSILDELVYKLSVSSSKPIASTSIKVIIEAVNCEAKISALISTRYKGLKAILKRWLDQGFNSDVKHLIIILESGSNESAELAIKARAVSVILAYYRGWKTRQRVKHLHKVIPNLQESYRSKIENKRNAELQNKETEEKKHKERLNLQRSFRAGKEKRLEMLKIVPASSVNSHIVKEEENAAVKIQSVWRTIITKKKYNEKLKLHKLAMSAVIIQRAVRKFLEKRKKLNQQKHAINPNYENLSIDRRNELDMQIKQWQTINMKADIAPDQIIETHDKTQTMLKTFHLNLVKEKRFNKPRRDALLAKLHTEDDLLKSLPKLSEATYEDIEKMACNSVAVKMVAEKEHRKMLNELSSQWWKKLAVTEDEQKELYI